MMFLQIAFEVAVQKVTLSNSYMIIKPCCSFSLKFLQQCLLVWSRSFKDIPYDTYHLKDFNNYNSFLALLSFTINFKVTVQCHSVKCAMSIFINILVSINFFLQFIPSSKDKPLAVILMQLDQVEHFCYSVQVIYGVEHLFSAFLSRIF